MPGKTESFCIKRIDNFSLIEKSQHAFHQYNDTNCYYHKSYPYDFFIYRAVLYLNTSHMICIGLAYVKIHWCKFNLKLYWIHPFLAAFNKYAMRCPPITSISFIFCYIWEFLEILYICVSLYLSLWKRCKNRASRPSQGTVNGGAVSKLPRCRWDVKHNQPTNQPTWYLSILHFDCKMK